MKSQSIAFPLNRSKDIYWILDLEGEAHSIWDLWISGLQEYNGNGFFEVGWAGKSFRSSPENMDFSLGGCPCPNLPPPKSALGGILTYV